MRFVVLCRLLFYPPIPTKGAPMVQKRGAISATYHPGFKAGGTAHETWKWKFFVLPNPEANEALARYLAQRGIVEEHVRCMALPGYAEKQLVYALRKDVMDKVSASHDLRNSYKAFVQYREDGKIYRYRTPEQIEAAKNRRTRKLMRRGRFAVTPAK